MNVGVYFGQTPPNAGGGYTFEDGILQALCENSYATKHKFIVYLSSLNDPQRIERLTEYNVKVIIIPKHVFTIAKICKALRRIINIVSPSISAIICKNPFNRIFRKDNLHLFWFPTPTAVDVDIPYIYTLWDIQHRLQPFFPEVSVQGEWEARELTYSNFISKAVTIIVGSKIGQLEVEQFYQIPSNRIRILPHPTPLFTSVQNNDEKPIFLEQEDLQNDYLLYPAQFWPHKNHVNLLLSLKVLEEKYNLSLHMYFAGSDKGNEGYVKNVVRNMGLSSRVHFLGFVSQQKLKALYKHAFALTYVTYFGPDNLPPLEAFALGTPVIASNVSGAKEQLGDAALLVDPKSPEQIAEAINALHSNPELREDLIKKGLSRASIWSSDDFLRGVISIIDDFEPIRRCWE